MKQGPFMEVRSDEVHEKLKDIKNHYPQKEIRDRINTLLNMDNINQITP